MKTIEKGYLYLVLAALCYASMGALVRELSVSFGPLWQTFLRLIVSFGLTFAFATRTRKPLRLQQRQDYTLMPLMGIVGYGLQLILFTAAIYHNTIGNTLFVFSCYPIITSVLAHFILRERITKRLGVAMVLLGCVLFLLFNPNNFGQYMLGNIYALLACVANSLYIICSRIMAKRGNAPETITLWSAGYALATSGVAALLFEKVSFRSGLLPLFYLVLFGALNSGAFNLMNKGFAAVTAGIGTMISLLEPVIGSVLGIVFFHEIPGVLFALGAVIMMAAIYIASFRLD